MVRKEIKQEKIIHHKLLLRINALRTDRETIKKLARSKFGLVEPGEDLYVPIFLSSSSKSSSKKAKHSLSLFSRLTDFFDSRF